MGIQSRLWLEWIDGGGGADPEDIQGKMYGRRQKSQAIATYSFNYSY